jgi:excinuclease ABC subunit C
VTGLFQRPAFAGFGANSLLPTQSPLVSVKASRPARLRDKVHRLCPRQPGVYGMVDEAGELVYVGKAKSLRSRLLSYFRPKSRDPKAGRIVSAVRLIAWEPAGSEFAALLRELELIRRFQPRHNVQGQPKRRRRVYLCLGRRPAPCVLVTRRVPVSALAVFGPVAGVVRAREAARRLNDLFGLRDCPRPQEMHFADERELFPLMRAPGCLRHEIGTCLGPCAGACSRQDYNERVRSARRFLAGTDLAPLERLEKEMAAAAASLSFERAAGLRDKIAVLTWLTEHLARVRQAAVESFVYPVPGWDGSETWYLVRGGLVRAALPAPQDGASRRAAFQLLEGIYGTDTPPEPLALDEVDQVLLIATWFRRHPGEWARTWHPRGVGQGEDRA